MFESKIRVCCLLEHKHAASPQLSDVTRTSGQHYLSQLIIIATSAEAKL